MSRLRLTLLAASLVPAPAFAASPDAWAANQRAATRACIVASGLRDATVLPQRVGFPDTLGLDAMLVRGTWRPRHMNGASGTMLCLYRRATKQATTVEATGWTVRP